MAHLMPEDVPEEDFTTITDINSIYDLFNEDKISLAELDRLKSKYYKWYYSEKRHTTVLRFYRQPDGTMTTYEQVYVQTYGESGNPDQCDKYVEVRARELSAKTSEPFEEVLEVLRRPIEAPHYRVLGWIVREEPGTMTAEFGLATGITVEPGLPETVRKVYIAHEIGHGESICKRLQKGEPVSFTKEFECLAWQEGIPAAKELGVLDEYFEHWCKEADYLGCYPPNSTSNPAQYGTCYEDAWRFLIKQEEGHLIHGSVQLSAEAPRVNHAWVELPTGWVWEPQTKDYYTIEDFKMMSPIEDHRYSVEEAAIMVARVGKHGPWTGEERARWL